MADWRSADREESTTIEGSVERRRAVAKTRRARWAFEDAARAAAVDQGGAAETHAERTARVVDRLREASDAAAALQPGTSGREQATESQSQREKRVEDEAEIERELAE